MILDDEFESVEALLREIDQQLARMDKLLNEFKEVDLICMKLVLPFMQEN